MGATMNTYGTYLAINVEIAKRLGWKHFRAAQWTVAESSDIFSGIIGDDPDGDDGVVPSFDLDGDATLLAILKLAKVEIKFSPPVYAVVAETPTGERSIVSHKYLYEALFLLLIGLLGVDADDYRQDGKWVNWEGDDVR